jgi:hypothetical protein
MAVLSFDDLLSGGDAAIPEWLDSALEWQESRGNPNAVSPKGAFGLRQLMPATAADPGFGIKPFDFNAPDKNAENVRVGRDYLGAMLNEFGGNTEHALAAYNWGPAKTRRWVEAGADPARLPRETRNYITNIMAQRPQDGAAAQAPAQAAARGVVTFDDLLGEGQQAQASTAPDMPEPRTLSGFVDNVGENAYEIGSGIASGVANIWDDPEGSLNALLNADIEDVEGFIGDTVRATGRDLGFHVKPDKTIGWDKDRLATNLYERPIDVGLSAAMVTPAAVNPLRLAAKGVGKAGGVAAKPAKYIAGEMSGVGPKAIEEAYRSGRVGGTQGEAFRAGMRGTLDPDAPVDVARGAVDELKADRKAEYLQGKETWKDTPGTMSPMTSKRLAWDPVEAAFESAMGIKRYRGKDINPHVAKARGEVRAVLDEWKADPGSWTPEGFDSLKQRLEGIRQGLNPMTDGAARSMVGATVHAVRRQIAKQAPEYAKTMKAYERASKAIEEVQRTLSLGQKASYDTALRKLQSVLRNNAFTNWTARAKLAELLAEKAPDLMPMLSGMAANSVMPRGLPAKLLGPGGIGAAGAMSGAMSLNPMALPAMLAAGVAASPRAVGEIAHKFGQVRGGLDKAAPYSPLIAGLLNLGRE